MENTRRGFIGMVLVMIIAIVAIGGGAYVYIHKSSSEALTVQDVPAENSAQIGNEITPKKAIPSPVVTTATDQNCGAVLDAHVLFESDKRTTEETKALGCISKAILSCFSASLDVTGDDAGVYQVFNKSGENCVIGSTFGGNRKCDVPLKVISDLEKYSIRKKEPIENLIAPISLLLGFGEAKDVETGETIKISCKTD